jgi:hypothetical protein
MDDPAIQFSLYFPLLGNCVSHTASRIFYISFAPWNKVYVAVKHGLLGSLDRLSAPQLANRRHIPTVSEAIMV